MKKIFFWQPKEDVLRFFLSFKLGKYILIFLNYIIWIFLFFISYLLIRHQINIFWQILFSIIIGEIIERIGKKKMLWRRPLYLRKDKTPPGLVDRWYKTGSFPSGHTIKAVCFLLFLLQYPNVFNPTIYLLITTPLLFFRILIGFHYPIDMIGGIFFGFFVWFVSKGIVVSEYLNNFIRIIFNFVFFIK